MKYYSVYKIMVIQLLTCAKSSLANTPMLMLDCS